MGEEYLTDFPGELSELFGLPASFNLRIFTLALVVTDNALALLAAYGLRRGNPVANYMVWFYTVGPGLVNAIAHVAFPIIAGRPYFPGLVTVILSTADPPDLAIDDDVDLVVASDRCAVLSPTAFTTLFGDVGVAFEQVPVNVTGMSDALKGRTPPRLGYLGRIERQMRSAVSDAKRLHHIVTERKEALKALTRTEIEALLERRGLEGAIQDGELRLVDDNISDFLDLVEGRLFNDDVTGEERRADSYSPRKR